MARRSPAAALLPATLAAVVGAILIAPAAAQFGAIFGDPPPRPPSSVPGGRQSIPAPPSNPSYPPQQQDYPPQQQGSYPSTAPGGAPGAVQQRPLPPPPGTAAVDPTQRAPGAPGAPPQQRPRGPQPADTSPQPGDEVITEPASQKITNSAALFSGLDKITGRIINFDVATGETVQFGALQVTPRACYTRPPTESANTDAFVEVDEVTLQGEVKRIFTGWMFASSPGLHGVEHAIYDVWLTNCKGAVQTVTAAPDPAPTPPPARTQPQPRTQQPVQPQQPARRPPTPPR